MKVVKMNKTKTLDRKKQLEFETNAELNAYNIEWLMENEYAAIKLQLENLMITYGEDKVLAVLDKYIKKVG